MTKKQREAVYELEGAALDILNCCELNLDELEPDTIAAIARLNQAIVKTTELVEGRAS